MKLEITEDEFEKMFKPQDNHLVEKDGAGHPCAGYNGWLFDPWNTEEAKYIEQILKENSRRIWTVVSTDSQIGIGLIQGWNFINREGYVICEVPFSDEFEYEILEEELSDLDYLD